MQAWGQRRRRHERCAKECLIWPEGKLKGWTTFWGLDVSFALSPSALNVFRSALWTGDFIKIVSFTHTHTPGQKLKDKKTRP